jgi:hypothetical protein
MRSALAAVSVCWHDGENGQVGRASWALAWPWASFSRGWAVLLTQAGTIHSLSNIPMLFQFKSKAPNSKIQKMIFLFLKILQTLHDDRNIQIEQFSFLVQLPKLSRF